MRKGTLIVLSQSSQHVPLGEMNKALQDYPLPLLLTHHHHPVHHIDEEMSPNDLFKSKGGHQAERLAAHDPELDHCLVICSITVPNGKKKKPLDLILSRQISTDSSWWSILGDHWVADHQKVFKFEKGVGEHMTQMKLPSHSPWKPGVQMVLEIMRNRDS